MPGLEHRDPDAEADQHRRRPAPGAREAQPDQHAEQAQRDGERDERDLLRVGDRDDQQRDQVVDDDHREEEDAQPDRPPARDQREHAERQRGVGRHGRAPAGGALAPGVDREVDRGGGDHPAEAAEDRDGDARALAQLSDVELALGLEPDDEEEQGHQALVDPAPQVGGELVVAERDRELGLPQRRVGVGGDVRPRERHERRDHERGGAAGLGREIAAHGRREVAHPGGAALAG